MILRYAWRLTVALLLILAAASKIANPQELLRVFLWDGIPSGLLLPGVWLIVLIEFTLGTALFLWDSKRLFVGTILLFLVYTSQLGLLYSANSAPPCGCMKLFVAESSSTHSTLLAGIIRNALIVVTGLIAVFRSPGEANARAGKANLGVSSSSPL